MSAREELFRRVAGAFVSEDRANKLIDDVIAEAVPELESLRARVAELEAAARSSQIEPPVDPAARWRRIEAERPEAGITHRCGIPLTRRLDCGHCPHEVCEDCKGCPHTCRCGTPVTVPQQRGES